MSEDDICKSVSNYLKWRNLSPAQEDSEKDDYGSLSTSEYVAVNVLLRGGWDVVLVALRKCSWMYVRSGHPSSIVSELSAHS